MEKKGQLGEITTQQKEAVPGKTGGVWRSVLQTGGQNLEVNFVAIPSIYLPGTVDIVIVF